MHAVNVIPFVMFLVVVVILIWMLVATRRRRPTGRVSGVGAPGATAREAKEGRRPTESANRR